MKKFAPYTGLLLIIVGTLVLVAAFAAGLTHLRSLLLGALAAIVAGIVLHIRTIKRQSRY
ncbi:MAG: hypothetical protein IJ710_09335 [Prevotella sp.]|nr:hypothetical protein [Prevotella sp.]